MCTDEQKTNITFPREYQTEIKAWIGFWRMLLTTQLFILPVFFDIFFTSRWHGSCCFRWRQYLRPETVPWNKENETPLDVPSWSCIWITSVDSDSPRWSIFRLLRWLGRKPEISTWHGRVCFFSSILQRGTAIMILYQSRKIISICETYKFVIGQY